MVYDRVFGCLLASFVALSAPAAAQESMEPNKIPASSPFRLLDTAELLARYGRETSNPLALIVATQLADQAGLRTANRTVEHEGSSAGEAPKPKEPSWLEEAAALAKGDPAVLSLLDDVKASARKGLVQGLGATVSSVPGSGNDWYRNLAFKAGEYAEAKVDILNSGGIRLFIYDASDNLVCKDSNTSARHYCGWTPNAIDKFSIKIENRGASAVKYKLITN
ncbi:MAG: hypothetical protein CFE31_11030 [Rhizobiales bacterium PAR1]|nr:MAG: hypothetical protein CFE31_11030 [Rhizobiales bacterium PAR1]